MSPPAATASSPASARSTRPASGARTSWPSGAKTSRPRWIVAGSAADSSRVAWKRASPCAPIAPAGVSGSSATRREVGLRAGLDARERPRPGGHARRAARRVPPAGEPEGRLRERGRHARRRLADRPVTRTHALGVVVVRLEQRLLLRADGDDRRARRDQMRDGFQLGVLERAGGVEAAHDLGGGRDGVVQVMAVRTRRGDGELAHAQRARDVAEVDHPARHQPAGAISPADDVPIRHVAVHDLARQPRAEPLDGLGRRRADSGARARACGGPPRAERAPRRPRRHDVDPTASRGRRRRARSPRATRDLPATAPSERSTGGARWSRRSAARPR